MQRYSSPGITKRGEGKTMMQVFSWYVPRTVPSLFMISLTLILTLTLLSIETVRSPCSMTLAPSSSAVSAERIRSRTTSESLSVPGTASASDAAASWRRDLVFSLLPAAPRVETMHSSAVRSSFSLFSNLPSDMEFPRRKPAAPASEMFCRKSSGLCPGLLPRAYYEAHKESGLRSSAQKRKDLIRRPSLPADT